MVIGGVPIFRYNKKECEKISFYHYTSLNALYSILKNKELWLGNAAAMNDKNEIKEFFKSLKKWLINRNPDKEELIKKLLNNATKHIEGKYPFVMSFSTWEDDAAQWERYGDKASGVCIKFNIPKLAELLVDFPMSIDKIYYGADISDLSENDQKEISNVLNSAEDILNQNEEGFNENMLKLLVNFAAKYKNKGFSSECEYRLYTYKWMASNTDIDKLLQYDSRFQSSVSIDFNFSGNLIKKVMKIKLDKLNSDISLDDIIEKIIIGPRSIQSISALKEYIKSLGYSVIHKHIEKSECTLI